MKQNRSFQASILAASLIVAGALIYSANKKQPSTGNTINNKSEKLLSQEKQTAIIEKEVLPKEGVVLPVRWGDLGAKMTSVGVIDKIKLEELYAGRGGLGEEERKMLEDLDNGYLKITPENSGFVLNLLWALGLGNKNEILKNGPMTDKKYGAAGRFASTGGWTLAEGDPMNHYSAHRFMVLTPEQQTLVEKVSKGIYRPCCGNSTYFPDCNHGMAMLGLLELMASQGADEEQMYKTALIANVYWFPDTYITIAKYLKSQGKDWNTANPKELLSYDYSSGPGYQKILEKIENPRIKSGGGCNA